MQNSRRDGTRVGSGKYWLAGGVMAAGLGAAVVTGAATATAATDDAGAASPAASASRDTESSPTQRAPRSTSEGTPNTASDNETEKPTDVAVDADEDDTADTEADDTAEDADADADDTAEDADDEELDVEVVEVDDGSDVAPGADVDDGSSAGEDDTAGPAAPVVAKDRDRGSSSTTVRTPRASAVTVGTAKQAVSESGSAATTSRAVSAAVVVESDPVLIAAATSTKVTWGSMIVDTLYSWGIRSKKMGTDWLAVKVSQATTTRWLVKRSFIYRNVVIPQPGNPTTPSNPTNPSNPNNPSTPTTPGTPRLLWETNFSSIDEAMKYWGFQTGRWGQSAGENQYYTDGDNVYIDAGGNLVIEARREATPDGLGSPNNYTSARVVTMGKQSIGVGTRVVARIQMPVTKGVLPAFWSVGLEPGHEYDWPRQGEIDIVEIPTVGTPASAATWTGNIHGPSAGNNTVDVKLQNINANLGVDLSQGFHDYGMDWYSDRIIWHVDGVQVGQVTKAQYEALGGNWTPFSGAWDHYLILNVAVGNPWNGDPSPTGAFQAQMKVDYVKAYAL